MYEFLIVYSVDLNVKQIKIKLIILFILKANLIHDI